MPIFGRMHSRLSALPVVTAKSGMLSFGCPSPCVRGKRVCAAVSAVVAQQATLGMVICRRQRPSWMTRGMFWPHGALVMVKAPLTALVV